jgi:hypothetical protein
MKNLKFTFEHLVYMLALLAAAAYRLIALGAWPLSEVEAGLALSAFDLAAEGSTQWMGQPSYLIITGFLFRLFGSGELLARLFPAVLGTFLVGLPYFWRDRLGRLPALLLAVGLAFEPSLVAASRMVGSPMIALFFLLAALTAWEHQRYSLAGAAFSLALLSGSSAWLGILIVLLTWLLLRSLTDRQARVSMARLRPAAIAFGLVLLFAGTFFLRTPQGIAGIANGLVAFVAGWSAAQGSPLLAFLAAWLVYQPFALIFGLVGFVLLMRKERSQAIIDGAIALAAMLVVMLYPGRAIIDLAWLSIPLLLLSASGLALLLDWSPGDGVVAWGQMALVFCFLCFAWLDLASLNGVFDPTQVRLRLIIAGAVLLITFVSTFLVGMGWDYRAAARGLGWGYALFLFVYVAGIAWTSTHIAEHRVQEAWYAQPAPGLSAELVQQIEHISETNVGHDHGIDIVYLNDSAALSWALRDFPEARYATQLGTGELPSIVIANQDTQGVFLQASYRGESFAWQRFSMGIQEQNFPFLTWFFRREAPNYSEDLVMWVRGDAFPSGSLIPAADLNADSGQPSEAEEDIVPDVGQ